MGEHAVAEAHEVELALSFLPPLALPFTMPYARITSNVSKASVDTVAVSTAVAKTLNEQWGIPAAFMMVQLELEVPVLLQLNDEVCLNYSLRCG
ncbi:unnamed protein product [Phytophthora fragariaefolia]|uniref:Unnamed protein product n=1 Tax=Phytophthora fragariaefolia TaxID=1490495 RepID=A0A9W7CYL0_9STRA|nr:unnamed protein product [Phytophthora fragariaefolia]